MSIAALLEKRSRTGSSNKQFPEMIAIQVLLVLRKRKLVEK
ncbi:hypothetical protein [Candidatus Enterococcus murrayae]|nr:hypothetical protein [Enterococcus sp. MJM16]